MSNTIFRFKIGDFNCTTIRDADDGERNALLIQTSQQNILIEVGIGHMLLPPSPNPGLLADRLPAAGVTPAEVDLVLLSHADFDHIAGAVDEDGNPAFPRARYVLHRDEWAYWIARPERIRPSEAYTDFLTEELCRICRTVPPERLAQLRDRQQLIDAGSEIAPGIHAIGMPGHTPGHTAYAVSSGGEQVLFVGDLFYDPQDIGNAQWHAAIDVDPAQSAATRERRLGQAANDHTLLMAYHAPFPGLGHVVRQGSRWEWQPLAVTV
jgi:glyoxylase-like metal-dependent hydrolase (beta-lactamase superfamily II)